MSKDYIKRFKKVVSSETDAPTEFIELAGYHLISSTIGRNFYIPGHIGDGRLNLWFLLSSIPGRFRRSTIQNYHNDGYKKAVEMFRKKTKNESRKDAKNNTRRTFLETGSPEGVIDHIQEFDGKHFVIMSHEAGGLLSGLKSKSYQDGLRDTLSKLYYGQSGYQYFSRKGKSKSERFIPPNMYVTMFTGLQDPRDYITEDFFRQGLMRRIIVAKLKESDKRIEKWKESWKSPMRNPGKHGHDETKKIGKELGNLMLRLYKARKKLDRKDKIYPDSSPLIHIRFSPKAEKIIESYSKKVENRVVEDRSNQSLYLQSQGEKLIKLSAVRAISKLRRKKESGEPVMFVTDKDVEESKDLLDGVTGGWLEIIPDIGTKKASPSSERTGHEMILKVVNTNDGATHKSNLLNNVSEMSANEVEKYLKTLVLREDLHMALVQGKPGPNKQVFGNDYDSVQEFVNEDEGTDVPCGEDVDDDYNGLYWTKIQREDSVKKLLS